ncbi:MAG: Mur ligase family protein, partial [Nitriliruptoraceae bacterium]
MIELTCEEVAAATGGQLSIPSAGAVIVDDVTADSRLVPEGRPLFVALATASGDGHDHARAAVAAGATAVLATRPLDVDVPVVVVDDTWQALRRLATHVRSRVGPVAVGITGSVGKTTVKDLTAAAVGAGRRTHAARGSYNNELGVPLTVLGMPADAEVLVAEVGARRSGNIAELAPVVAPDVAVVTAVAPAHLGVFGSIEAIAATKAELVESLGPRGVAVRLDEVDRRQRKLDCR